MSSAVTILVPATSANLGPGFDCLGLALQRYNTFSFTLAPNLEITARGHGAEQLDCSANNLAYRSFCSFFEKRGGPIPSVSLEITLDIPLARGLGSSATAIVGGLLAANSLVPIPETIDQLLQLAVALEGHPDNVAPALLGGCQLSLVKEGMVHCRSLPWPSTVTAVVVIPEFSLSTAEARAVLPQVVPRADALFNSTRLGWLLLALSTGRSEDLKLALEDRLHQPYREPLIPGFAALRHCALEQGAYGLVISGAGPTVLALSPPAIAAQVGKTLVETWATQGIQAKAQSLPLDCQGARILAISR